MYPDYDSGEEYVFNWKLIAVFLTSIGMWVAIVRAVLQMVR